MSELAFLLTVSLRLDDKRGPSLIKSGNYLDGKEGNYLICTRKSSLNKAESTLRNIRESILRITTEDYRREAVGFEGRAAHGSGVGAVENVGDFAILGKILRHLELLRSRAASA